MSKVLYDARRKLTQVGGMLRQDKYVNAAQMLYSGLQSMLQAPLLRSEKDEFADLIKGAVAEVNYNRKLQQLYNLQLVYTPGDEQHLLEMVRIMLDSMEEAAMEEADRIFQEREADKKARLALGLSELENGRADDSRKIFSALLEEYPDDPALLLDMAEAFEKAGLNADAAGYFEKAARLDPGSSYILNKLGVIHRKLKRFAESEQAFDKALALAPDNAFIHFNAGRLHIDSQNWVKAKEAAEKALECQPDLSEARKMAEYAVKRL